MSKQLKESLLSMQKRKTHQFQFSFRKSSQNQGGTESHKKNLCISSLNAYKDVDLTSMN